NPDLAEVISMPARPRLADTLSLGARLFRRYDLAVSVQTGDRPIAFALIAGHHSVGPVEPEGLASAIKRALLGRSYIRNRSDHRVVDVLRLADVMGIPALRDVVFPSPAPRARLP